VVDAFDEEAQRHTRRVLFLADRSVPEHCPRPRRAGSRGRDRASQRARSLQRISVGTFASGALAASPLWVALLATIREISKTRPDTPLSFLQFLHALEEIAGDGKLAFSVRDRAHVGMCLAARRGGFRTVHVSPRNDADRRQVPKEPEAERRSSPCEMPPPNSAAPSRVVQIPPWQAVAGARIGVLRPRSSGPFSEAGALFRE
jgi:hypothetical protein